MAQAEPEPIEQPAGGKRRGGGLAGLRGFVAREAEQLRQLVARRRIERRRHRIS